MNRLDVFITSFLNRFAHRSFTFDEFVVFLSVTNLLKGGVILGLVWWVWFEKEDVRNKREALLAGLMASIPALIIAKVLTVVTFRYRPVNEARLVFHPVYGADAADWQQLSSFPSDHAVLFFALATAIFFVSRRAGYFPRLCFRVHLPTQTLPGEHYLTDVLAGAAIGIFPAWLANLPRIRKPLTSWALRWMDSSPSQFYSLAFIATYQIAELFDPLLKILHYLRSGQVS
jgi:undecaprenyl-diphosphatase